MTQATRGVVFWAPRILCMAFAAFLAVFALDVFGMPLSLGQRAIALAMHLIPTAIVLVFLVIVWRREWMGAVLFPLLAVLHLVTKWGQLHWTAYVGIEAPLVLVGLLFWASWRARVPLSPSA